MTLQTLLAQMDLNPRAYSGRGMYGRECLGVSVEDPVNYVWDIATAVAEYNAEADDDDQIDVPGLLCYDQLGRGYIVYWPRIPYDPKGD